MFQPISKAIDFSNPNFMRSVVLPVVVAAVALATAFIGALIIGSDSGIDDVNLFVERLSGDSSSWLGGLVGASALFALAAGMASAVNPCGFAMLPAYLGMYLGDAGDPEKVVRPVQQIGRAVLVA